MESMNAWVVVWLHGYMHARACVCLYTTSHQLGAILEQQQQRFLRHAGGAEDEALQVGAVGGDVGQRHASSGRALQVQKLDQSPWRVGGAGGAMR